MKIEMGAPADASLRPEAEREVYALLERLAIPYERVEHPAAETMEMCQEAGAALGVPLCKNLVLCNRQKTAFYLLLMPGDKPFRTKQLSAQIGSARLSFAPPEDMERLLKVTPGSASVLSLMHDTEREVRLLVDEDLLEDDYIACHPCRNTASLKLPAKAVWQTFLGHTGHSLTAVHLSGEDSE